ncbi:MAG TPA: VanZ family protein [Oscillospiraceae bacterium]|nr:VanZ family protein [Oscillospiraceae bacterium]
MRKRNWFVLLTAVGTLYYLSSIPSLRVLPVLRQINNLLKYFDLTISKLAIKIATHLPTQLAPAKTLTADFLNYARRNPVIIEFLLRKAAHVFFFFVITLAFFLLLRNYFRQPWQAIVSSFLGGTIFAILDEFHQGFVMGRHGNYVDVCIDMVGVLTAVFLLVLSFWLTNQHRKA